LRLSRLNGIVFVMSARQTEPPTTDDLFSAVAKKPDSIEPLPSEVDVSPDLLAPPSRYLLPKDLPGALAHLDTGEFDALLTAVIEETRRRGRLTPGLAAKLMDAAPSAAEPPKTQGPKPAPPSRPEESKGDRGPSLTTGQTNAVRAAFMAGVKPTTIARQFGISQSAVRTALAKDTRLRKR
jgi:hypothetical protein